MQVWRVLICEELVTQGDAAWRVIVETSILSQVKSESFLEAMEVDHHRKRVNINAVHRNRN